MSPSDPDSSEDTLIAQRFGGPWSLIKADMVEKYIKFFNTALKAQSFERVYIDAFAGSGAFRYVPIDTKQVSMFRSHDQSEYIHAGSALRALRANPPFHRIVFIEKEKSNVAALQELIDKSDHRAARVIHGDANTVLRELCRSEDWRKQRGVIFLDPFGMSVDWPTLETIAATRALDVWFLFPLIGTIRNLPRLASALDAGKRLAVTRVLGTDEWFTKFYSPVEEGGMMLGSRAPAIVRRTATVDEIEAYVRARLRTIFPHVEVPVRLRAPRNKSLFSLFFAVSNPSAGAINLAVKGARHILAQA